MTRALLFGALAIALGYAALEAAGARELVSVLSGTLPSDDASLMLGLGYAAARFALVVLAPILVLAAGLDVAMRRIELLRRHRIRAATGVDLRRAREHASLRADEREPEDRGVGRER